MPRFMMMAMAVCTGFASVGASRPAVPREAVPVAIELFTSQGCSSCPPADAVLARLAEVPGIVAISRPVTYWDRLGWKDTLAHPRNTALQRAYAERGMRGGGTYTPQAVVQGRVGVVGSREGDIRALVATARKLPAPKLHVANGTLRLSNVPNNVVVSMVTVQRESVVRIGRGENGGRQVRYVNHVVDETRLTPGRGGYAVSGRAARGQRRLLLVRNGQAGPILAVRWI